MYPHPFYGFYLLKGFDYPRLFDEYPLELAAILGHHTQLYSGLYDGLDDYKAPEYLEEEINDFLSQIYKKYRKLGFDEYFALGEFSLLAIPKYRTIKAKRARNSLITKKFEDKEKIKSIFTYLFSILQTCDDYSSVEFSDFVGGYEGDERFFGSVMRKASRYTLVLDIEDPVETVLGQNKPYRFQKEIYENAATNSLLFAPCGRGKTEAALLWASKIMETYNRNKIIFAMPTQTTSNAMYERMCELFGRENVGLFHGRSYIKLKRKKEEESPEAEERDVGQIKDETFKGNVFFKPITVTTIDHLILSFVHGFSQADFALGNGQNSVLVFDEVHYYEKKTLEHLVTLFKMLNKKNVPHLLMSGTFPEFLKREVSRFGNYTLFEDSEGLEFKPFSIKKEEQGLADGTANPEVLEEIKSNYKKGLSQFVILNTVERAKTFYRELSSALNESNVVLYHSQFTFNDRVKKEKEIMEKVKEKPFILVATQVIEVSLDISCDIMYTELAPPDALGQRAGRLNRKGKSPSGDGVLHELKIYSPENELPYKEDLISYSLENLSAYEKECSYSDIKDFCDIVYDRMYEKIMPSNLKSVFRECTLFGYSPRQIAFDEEAGKIIQIREDNYQKIEVIPEVIFHENGHKALSVENAAKVPLWWLQSDEKEGGESHFYPEEDDRGKVFKICSFPYDYSTGFEYKKENSGINII